jgi:hypothetical protein
MSLGMSKGAMKMKDGTRIKKLLEKMEYGNYDENFELLEIAFGDLTRVSKNTGKNIIQELVSRKYDEKKLEVAIRTLFRKLNFDPNHLDKRQRNFVQLAIQTGYSCNFVCDCTRMSLARGIDVNHTDDLGDTVVHTAIKSTNFKDSFTPLLKLVDVHGYKASTKNNDGKDISDLIFESHKYDKIAKMKIISDMIDIVGRPKNLIVKAPRPILPTSKK